jgi:very-short-patch-repair endonuclease
MTREEALRKLAEIQHSLVARSQAARLRLDWDVLARRITTGEWELATPRVLRRTGAEHTRNQDLMLAVLDGPPGTFLAAFGAGELWQLPGFRSKRPEVVQSRSRFRRSTTLGTRHRPTLLLPHHVTEVQGIPVTTLPRTIFDLAARIPEGRLDRLIEMTIAKSPGMLPALRTMLDELACRGRPGIAVMRKLLAKRPGDYVACQSGLELRFDRILEEAGAEPLTRQVDVGGHDWLARVDFRDLLLRILFEVDSILHHTTPGDRARDQARDRALKAAGWADVVRVPEEEIWYQPWLAVERVRAARAAAARARSRDEITPDSGVISSQVRRAQS